MAAGVISLMLVWLLVNTTLISCSATEQQALQNAETILIPFQINHEAESDKLLKGQSTYEQLQQKARSHSCWEKALLSLVRGCRDMTEDDQSRFAVELANCHLERSGLSIYPCPRTTNIADCTRAMATNPIAFNSYTEFFIHADNLCFYLQSKSFQHQTERSVALLVDSTVAATAALAEIDARARDMSAQLERTVALQRELERSQLRFADDLNALAARQEVHFTNSERRLAELAAASADILLAATAARRELAALSADNGTLAELTRGMTSSLTAQREFSELQRRTLADSHAILEGVRGLADLQIIIASAVIDIHAVLFWAAAVAIVLVATATPRTNEARAWLVLGAVAAAAIEMTAPIDGLALVVRRLWVVYAVVVTAYVAVRYRDYAQLNYVMLRELVSSHERLYGGWQVESLPMATYVEMQHRLEVLDRKLKQMQHDSGGDAAEQPSADVRA